MHTFDRVHATLRAHPWTLSFFIVMLSFGVINRAFFNTQETMIPSPPVLSALSIAYTLSPYIGATAVQYDVTSRTTTRTRDMWVTNRTGTTATVHFNLASDDITHIAVSMVPSFEGVISEAYRGVHTVSVAPDTTTVYVRFFSGERASEIVAVPIPSILMMSPGTPLTRTLFTGMSGDDVRTLQTILMSKGYLTTDTGYYDRETFAAVRRMQKDAGIAAIGITGPETRKFINQFVLSL